MLVRQGAIYHFRRRVPNDLRAILQKGELWYSLRTSDRREAKARAAALWAWTERIFRTDRGAEVLASDIEKLLKQAAEMLERGEDATGLLMKVEAAVVAEEAVVDIKKAKAEAVEAKLSEVRFLAAAVADQEASAAAQKEAFERSMAIMKELKTRYEEAHAGRRSAEATTGKLIEVLADRAPKDSPMFSALVDEFISDKCESNGDHKGYSAQTVKQVRVTLRFWQEAFGNKQVRTYTRAEAGEFIKLLKKVPSSHGKDGKEVSILEAIKAGAEKVAANKPVTFLSLKTVKRHFSALSQYWAWLKLRGHVDENIFSGFTFPGTKSNRKKRDMWATDDLKKILSAEWLQQDRKSAFYWLPLIALYSGMRLEEIATLRPGLDIIKEFDIWTFRIQDHPDGFSPKTLAGERLVPVHSALIDLGLLELVEERVRQKAPRLFMDLKPGGPDRKYGYNFSREFSKRKTALGIGAKTTFHSFRHLVRTLLENTKMEERFIDAIMGHEREQKETTEGAATYNKGLFVQMSKEVVEAIVPPVDVFEILGVQKPSKAAE